MPPSPARRGIGRVPTALGVVLLTWLALSELAAPVFLRRTYGTPGAREVPFLPGAADLDSLLGYWHSYSRTVSAVLALVTVLVLLAAWPPFQAYVSRRQGPAPTDPSSSMGRRRLLLVHAAIVTIIGGSTVAMLSGVELWPFSPYKMYSQLQVGSASRWKLFGTSRDGEVDLSRIPELTPFDPSRLYYAMQRVEGRTDRDQALDSVARYVWRRYEDARTAGTVASPALQTLKLYRYTWLIDDPRLKPRPDTAELIYQWSAPR